MWDKIICPLSFEIWPSGVVWRLFILARVSHKMGFQFLENFNKNENCYFCLNSQQKIDFLEKNLKNKHSLFSNYWVKKKTPRYLQKPFGSDFLHFQQEIFRPPTHSAKISIEMKTQCFTDKRFDGSLLTALVVELLISSEIGDQCNFTDIRTDPDGV